MFVCMYVGGFGGRTVGEGDLQKVRKETLPLVSWHLQCGEEPKSSQLDEVYM